MSAHEVLNNVSTLASILPNSWFCNQCHLAFKPVMTMSLITKPVAITFECYPNAWHSLFNPKTLLLLKFHWFNTAPLQELNKLLELCLLYSIYGEPETSHWLLIQVSSSASECYTISLTPFWPCAQPNEEFSIMLQPGRWLNTQYYFQAFSNLSKFL